MLVDQGLKLPVPYPFCRLKKYVKYGLMVVDVWRVMVFKAPATTDDFGVAMENFARALANPTPSTPEDHKWVYQSMLWSLDFVEAFYKNVEAGVSPAQAYQNVKDEFYRIGTGALFIDFFELAQVETVTG